MTQNAVGPSATVGKKSTPYKNIIRPSETLERTYTLHNTSPGRQEPWSTYTHLTKRNPGEGIHIAQKIIRPLGTHGKDKHTVQNILRPLGTHGKDKHTAQNILRPLGTLGRTNTPHKTSSGR